MHNYRISKRLDKLLLKLLKKDKNLFEQVMKKIKDIAGSYDLEHYKNLRYNLKEYKRTHVGHFVLVFSYNKKLDLISFEDFAHHDLIYKKK